MPEKVNNPIKTHEKFLKVEIFQKFICVCRSVRSIPNGTSCTILKISCKHFSPIFYIIHLLRKLKHRPIGVEIVPHGIQTSDLGVEAFKLSPLGHGASATSCGLMLFFLQRNIFLRIINIFLFIL